MELYTVICEQKKKTLMTISNNTSSWVGEKGLENCSRKSLLVK